jgi:hypothetical protein
MAAWAWSERGFEDRTAKIGIDGLQEEAGGFVGHGTCNRHILPNLLGYASEDFQTENPCLSSLPSYGGQAGSNPPYGLN